MPEVQSKTVSNQAQSVEQAPPVGEDPILASFRNTQETELDRLVKGQLGKLPMVGLRMLGVVMGVDYKVTEWEGQKSLRCDAKVTDGREVYPVSMKRKYEDAGEIPKLGTGDLVIVEKITAVKSEYGKINSVMGQITKFTG